MRPLILSLAVLALAVAASNRRRPVADQPLPAGAYVADVASLASHNTKYRKVVYTGPLSQIALMSIPPGGDIGEERHAKVEQLLFIVSGRGEARLQAGAPGAVDAARKVGPGDVVAVPPGVTHDIVNTGAGSLRLYTVYAPPNHLPGREQATKADAEADQEDQAYGHHLE